MAVIKSEYLLPNYDPEEVGMKGEKGDDGKTSYVHIAYSNSSDGGVDFSTTDPTNRAYTGYYTDFEMIDSTDPSKYAWQRTKGDSGKDGVAGKDGVGLQSTSITYASHTNASTPPSTGWQAQVPTVPAGQYLWTKTVWTYTDSSSETGYSVARMGQDGAKGNDGIAGKDGVGIKTTVIEYAVNTSGTVRPTSGWSTTIPTVPQGQYLWTRTTWTYTDNTTEQGYSVARQGEKGDKGDRGVPGTPGADGRTPYFHTAYAWSKDGTDRFTPSYPGENYVLKSKEPYVATGNGGSNQYPTGIAGIEVSPNIFGASVTIQYKVTISNYTSGTFLRLKMYGATGTWGSFSEWNNISGNSEKLVQWKGTLPPLIDGGLSVISFNTDLGANIKIEELCIRKGTDYYAYTPAPSEDYENAYPTYTGTYTDYTEVDSTNPVDYTWVRVMGDDGVGISTTIIEYNKSNNSTTPPSTGWTSTIPSISGGQYLWTRVTLNYTDGKKSESYTVARQGEDGADGQLFTGETEPTDFNEGDIWYKVVSGKVTGVYEAKGGTWVEIPFESSVIAETIIGKTIQGSHITGSVIEGGEINGSVINGGEFNNAFTEQVDTDATLSGNTTIQRGIIETQYNINNTETDAFLSSGRQTWNGVNVESVQNGADGLPAASSTFGATGIDIYNKEHHSQFGMVHLGYQDLMTLPKKNIVEYSPDFESYAPDQEPSAERYMRTVQLYGAFTNKKKIPANVGHEPLYMGTLPVGYRPSGTVRFVVPGSGVTRYVLQINANGRMYMYNTSGWSGSSYTIVDVNPGAWLNVQCNFIAGNI